MSLLVDSENNPSFKASSIKGNFSSFILSIFSNILVKFSLNLIIISSLNLSKNSSLSNLLPVSNVSFAIFLYFSFSLLEIAYSSILSLIIFLISFLISSAIKFV